MVLIIGLEGNYKRITDRAHGQTTHGTSLSRFAFRLWSFPTSHFAEQVSIIKKGQELTTSDQKFHSYFITIIRELQLKECFSGILST